MIKEFVEAWDENKGELEVYLRDHIMGEYESYHELVTMLFDKVINPHFEWDFERFVIDNIRELDDGDYQGTLVYVIHRDTYQPGPGDYVYTYVNYGSCSGCDTLLRITEYDDDKTPSDDQLKDLMQLCLHLLQNCRYMYTFEED